MTNWKLANRMAEDSLPPPTFTEADGYNEVGAIPLEDSVIGNMSYEPVATALLPLTFSFMGWAFKWEQTHGPKALARGVHALTYDRIDGDPYAWLTGRLPADRRLQTAEYPFFAGIPDDGSSPPRSWIFAYGNFWNGRDRVLDVAVPFMRLEKHYGDGNPAKNIAPARDYRVIGTEDAVPESEWLRLAETLTQHERVKDPVRRVALMPNGRATAADYWALTGIRLFGGNPAVDWENRLLNKGHPWLGAAPNNPIRNIMAGNDSGLIDLSVGGEYDDSDDGA